MTIFIGTDEAGLGPNIGPLVIGATAWQIPDASAELDLYEHLSPWVGREPGLRSVTIADSKLLYRPGAGLAGLERAVFPCLHSAGRVAPSWREIWPQLVPSLAADVMHSPWHCDYDEALPIDAPADELGRAAEQLHQGLLQAGVGLVAVQADAIFPREFNQLIAQHGSKGAVLSHRTLQLVERLLRTCRDPLTVVQCDKHGGRNGYLSHLQPVFPDYLVETVRESRAESVYRWGPAGQRIEFRFSVRGESRLPTALASMFAKYLRELAMRAFNAFWQAQSTGLRPTAGYPVDAKRFLAEIAGRAEELAIDRDLLWRCR